MPMNTGVTWKRVESLSGVDDRAAPDRLIRPSGKDSAHPTSIRPSARKCRSCGPGAAAADGSPSQPKRTDRIFALARDAEYPALGADHWLPGEA